MAMLPAVDIKELVRSKTDIVALIGETLALQPRHGGRLYVGLCPFHEDHNPSFNVNPERQTYRCWVCQKGGDCYSYIMEYEHIGFREALEMLAQRAGVELPKFGSGGDDRSQRDEKATLYEALTWAQQEFHRFLQQGHEAARARDYLKSRHFREETIRDYQLGYAADGWDWLLQRARNRFSPEQLAKAGLAKPQDPPRTGHRDAYVDRVMFPIHDERGRVISFGGRILPDSRITNTGKYINGTDTPVFHKSQVIFGLDKAREAIRKTGTAVVTEGYVDCIKAHQAGVLNAVGTLGTALTETHVSILKRSARRVVLVYDGDSAGQMAAVRAVEKFLAQDVDLRILTLPDELDPDEFLDAHGVAEFEQLIEQAPEAWEFQVRHALQMHGASVDGRLQALEELLGLLTIVPGMSGSVRENLLIARISQRLGIQEEVSRNRLRELRNERTAGARRKVPAVGAATADHQTSRREAIVSLQQRPQKDDLLETEILQVLFTAPHTIERVRQEVGTDDFQNEATRELLAISFDLWEQGDLPEFHRVLSALECPLLKSLAVWIDEQATARKLADQLAQDVAANSLGASSTGVSRGLVEQLLVDLKWRREVQRQQELRGQVAEQLQNSSGLNPELRELLERQTSFHQQRVAKKVATP
ncbi:DNA primase [bacterium]|nr:DNA primase [bacterium]